LHFSYIVRFCVWSGAGWPPPERAEAAPVGCGQPALWESLEVSLDLPVPAHSSDGVLPAALHVLQRALVLGVFGGNNLLQVAVLSCALMISSPESPLSGRSQGPPSCLQVIVFMGFGLLIWRPACCVASRR
jgi:hypothetical protein